MNYLNPMSETYTYNILLLEWLGLVILVSTVKDHGCQLFTLVFEPMLTGSIITQTSLQLLSQQQQPQRQQLAPQLQQPQRQQQQLKIQLSSAAGGVFLTH